LFGIVLAESIAIAIVGGSIGLVGARMAFAGNNPLNAFFPGFAVTGGTIALGLGVAALLGLVSGAVPAWQSARLSVVEALRRVA
jgi:putative ABC transport system permease protein